MAHIASTASTVQAESELVKSVDKISNFIMKVTLPDARVRRGGEYPDRRPAGGCHGPADFCDCAGRIGHTGSFAFGADFSLSRGALEFAKRDVIVKRLSAVQDLGSVNLSRTDKTGTITENHLVFSNFFPMDGSPYDPLVLARLAAINLHERIGNLSTMQAMRPSHKRNARLWSATFWSRRKPSIRRCAATAQS